MMLAVLIALTIATPVIWAFVIGTVIPALTEMLTKADAPTWVKAIVNLLLAAIGGGLSAALNANTLDAGHWEQIVVGILFAWLASVASFYGLWKPSGLSDKLQAATPRFGIG